MSSEYKTYCPQCDTEIELSQGFAGTIESLLSTVLHDWTKMRTELSDREKTYEARVCQELLEQSMKVHKWLEQHHKRIMSKLTTLAFIDRTAFRMGMFSLQEKNIEETDVAEFCQYHVDDPNFRELQEIFGRRSDSKVGGEGVEEEGDSGTS